MIDFQVRKGSAVDDYELIHIIMFVLYRLNWQAFSDGKTPTNIKVETSVSVYRNKPIAYFSIIYTSGLTNASIPGTNNQTLSTFPSFVIEDMDMKRGYFTWFKGRK